MQLLSSSPNISLEFTTPSNPTAEQTILDAANILQNYQIKFSCVNFGGGIISPERAMMMITKLRTLYNMPVIGYLRRSHIDKNHFDKLAVAYRNAHINTVFLTEGRRLNSTPVTSDHYSSLIHAINALKMNHHFKVAIEARPEHNHGEIDLIRHAIDTGVDEIVTRFSFNVTTTLRFLEKLSKSHATLPKIRIGVMPFENPTKTFLTAHRLNVQIPQFIQNIFNEYPEYDTVNSSISTHILLTQIQKYMDSGYHNFHIRFGRSHHAIETLCRFFNVPQKQVAEHSTSQAIAL